MARPPRGMYRRPDSKFWWIILPTTVGTKQKYDHESTKETSLEKATKVFDRRRQEVKDSALGEATEGPLTLTGLETHYLTKVSGKPSEGKVQIVFESLRARLGDIPLHNLSALKLESYIVARQKIDKVQPATIRGEIGIFKTALRKALKVDLVSDSVALKLLRVEVPKASKGRLRYLTLEEAIRLLKCCPLWLQKIVVFAIYTGFRMGEIRSLTWKNCDLQAGYIYLDKTKTGEKRHVPLMSTVLNLLRSQYRLGRRSPYVFCDAQGRPLKKSKVDHQFLDAVYRASIENFRFHDTRHTFASWAAMGGTEFYAISKLLGHASTKSTEIYTHLSPSHITRQVLALDPNPDLMRADQPKTNRFILLHVYFTSGAGMRDLDPMLFSGPSSAETDVSSGSAGENPDNSDMVA